MVRLSVFGSEAGWETKFLWKVCEIIRNCSLGGSFSGTTGKVLLLHSQPQPFAVYKEIPILLSL